MFRLPTENGAGFGGVGDEAGRIACAAGLHLVRHDPARNAFRRLGVSPWTWWADVPVPVRETRYIAPGRYVDAPQVRYRGIFLNDEDPALGGWIKATYGKPDHRFYERVFELALAGS